VKNDFELDCTLYLAAKLPHLLSSMAGEGRVRRNKKTTILIPCSLVQGGLI